MKFSKQTIKDGIYGLAVGDAVGVPFEFRSLKTMLSALCLDMRGGGTYGLPAGTWSDDTALTLASMQGMSDYKGIDLGAVLDRFCKWYEAGENAIDGKAFDIGNATKAALERWKKGYIQPCECGGTGERDNGNGSLMRILPAVLYSLAKNNGEIDFDFIAKMSALTHATKFCKVACGIYALVAREVINAKENKRSLESIIPMIENFVNISEEHFVYNSDVFDVFDRLKTTEFFSMRATETDENNKLLLKATGYVRDCLESSLWSLFNSDSYEKCILAAVNLGDDADTTAAVAGSLAGLYYGFDSIPQKWIDTLRGKEIIDKRIDEFAAKLKNEGKFYFGDLQSDKQKAENGDTALQFEIGQYYKNIHNYSMAQYYWQKAADAENPIAQYKLAIIYQNGQHSESRTHDWIKAAYWLEKAANNGHNQAQMQLASYYAHGHDGFKKNAKKSQFWRQKAAQNGNSEALYSIGLDYYCGNTVTKDYTKAVEYWQKAVEIDGHCIAKFMLGKAYEKALGVDEDFDKAFKFYFESAKQCWHSAQVWMGDWYSKHPPDEYDDFPKAVFWYKRAAFQGDTDGAYGLAKMYEYQFNNNKNLEALYWYTESAKGGNAAAMYKLGKIYKYGMYNHGMYSIDSDFDKSEYWYKKAAQKNHKYALEELNKLYENNSPKTKMQKAESKKLAKAYFDKIIDKAEKGYLDAMFDAGVCYYFGHGVKEDDTIAFEWWQKAAKGGFERANEFCGFDEYDY